MTGSGAALAEQRRFAAGDRRPIVVACCLLVVACVFSPAGAASTREAVQRDVGASEPVTLRAGDELVVSGTHLHCAVSTASGAPHPTTIVCGEGDLESPLPGTYAFALADQAALVIKSSATRQPELVIREAQPAESRATPASPRRSARTVSVRPGAIVLIGGSDVLCAVSSQAGTPTLTCGLAAGGSGTFIIDSYVGVLSERYALLTQLLSNSTFRSVVSRTQPAG